MRSRQSSSKSPLFEESFLGFGKGSKKPYKSILKKKKTVKQVASKEDKSKASSEKPKTSKVKDKKPLGPNQARSADSGKPVKISKAHEKNIAAYNEKKAAKSSVNAASVNLEETFTPKPGGAKNKGGIK